MPPVKGSPAVGSIALETEFGRASPFSTSFPATLRCPQIRAKPPAPERLLGRGTEGLEPSSWVVPQVGMWEIETVKELGTAKRQS